MRTSLQYDQVCEKSKFSVKLNVEVHTMHEEKFFSKMLVLGGPLSQIIEIGCQPDTTKGLVYRALYFDL